MSNNTADPDWELYYYEAERLDDQKWIINSLRDRAQKPPDFEILELVPTTGKALQEPTRRNTHGNGRFSPGSSSSSIGPVIPAKSPVMTRPKSAMSMTQPRPTSAKQPEIPLRSSSPLRVSSPLRPTSALASYHSAQVTTDVSAPAYPDPLLEADTVPGWPKLDAGSRIFDFLSPSRLHGPMPNPEKHVDTNHLYNPLLISRCKTPKLSQKNALGGFDVKTNEARKFQHLPEGEKPFGGKQSPSKPKSAPRVNIATVGYTSYYPSSDYRALQTRYPSFENLSRPRSPVAGKALNKPKPNPERKVRALPETTTKILTEEALKNALREQFLKYDLNGDGVISRKEAQKLLSVNVVNAHDADFKIILDYVVQKMDIDNDNKISYEEYEHCVLEEPLLRECFGTSGIIRGI